MRLNQDCIRDILLHCEKHCLDAKGVKFIGSEIAVNGKNYPRDVLWYHLRQCDLSGYLYRAKQSRNYYLVRDLMPKAHELLESIRDDEKWVKLKDNAVKAGIFALSVISKMAPLAVPGGMPGKIISALADNAINAIGKKGEHLNPQGGSPCK
jgi:hypothetical protein